MTLRPAISHRGSAAFAKGLFYDKRPKVYTTPRPSDMTYEQWCQWMIRQYKAR